MVWLPDAMQSSILDIKVQACTASLWQPTWHACILFSILTIIWLTSQKQRCSIKIPTPGIKHGNNAGLHWTLSQTSWLSANQTKPFCLYVQSGKDLTKSSPQLQGIFQHPGWQHFVQERLRQAEVLAPIASTTSQATASTSKKQHAIISGQASASHHASTSHHASMPMRRKRRKMIRAL